MFDGQYLRIAAEFTLNDSLTKLSSFTSLDSPSDLNLSPSDFLTAMISVRMDSMYSGRAAKSRRDSLSCLVSVELRLAQNINKEGLLRSQYS